jgi:hypothetical protein
MGRLSTRRRKHIQFHNSKKYNRSIIFYTYENKLNSVLLVDDDEATNFINRRIIENLESQIILKSLIMAKKL